MEIGKKDIEFLGYKISKGQVILQEHVLKVFTNFPDQILEKVQLQRFLGSLNYISPFYKGQTDDIHLLLSHPQPSNQQEDTTKPSKTSGKIAP